MELALIVTLAFTTGALSATLAALAWTRQYRDKLRQDLLTHQERMRVLEWVVLHRGGLPAPPPGRGW